MAVKIDSNTKYQKLGVYKKTHKQIIKITEQNGMRISDYIRIIIDKEYKRAGFSEAELESSTSNIPLPHEPDLPLEK